MTPSYKQANKPWVGHQKMSQFWALSMWFCRAGVQKIRTAGSLRISLAAMKEKQSSIADFSSQEVGQHDKEFHGLVRVFLAYFIQNYFFSLTL